jgi:hypothetical protein
MSQITQVWDPKLCAIHNSEAHQNHIMAAGRLLWALTVLREAGATGCTTLQTGVPRFAAYVHQLRKRGVWIETIKEPNQGEFPGYHARYVLRSRVQIGMAEAKQDG